MVVLVKNQDTTLMTNIVGFTLTGGTGYYGAYGGGIHCNMAIPVIEYNHIENCSVTGTQPHGAGIRVGQGDTSQVCIIRYNVIRNCTINAVSNTIAADGAGISLEKINAVVEGNTISYNVISGTATSYAYGGGIIYYMSSNYYHSALILIKNNVISNNGIESFGAYGGGIFFQDDFGYTRISVEGNSITGNELISIGTGGEINGGGIFMRNPGAGSNISDNAINNNHSDEVPQVEGLGGGIFITHELNPGNDNILLIEKNRITQNTAAVQGGGMSCSYIGLKMVNNFIAGNQSGIRAGGIYLAGQSDSPVLSFINNTFTGNSVTSQDGRGGSIYISTYPELFLINNIFFGNQAPEGNELYNNNLSTFVDGTWYYAPVNDIEETPRPWHMGIDVGADECDIIIKLPEQRTNDNLSSVRCYPNPFSTFTTLVYELEHSVNVNLSIYNHLGQQVALLLDGEQSAGRQKVRWEAEGMPAGVYYFRLSILNGRLWECGKIVKY